MSKQPLSLQLSLLVTSIVSILANENDNGGEEQQNNEENPSLPAMMHVLVMLPSIGFGIVVGVSLLLRFDRRRIVACDRLVEAQILEHTVIPRPQRHHDYPQGWSWIRVSYEYEGETFVAWEKYKAGRPNDAIDEISIDDSKCFVYIDPLYPRNCVLRAKKDLILEDASHFSVLCGHVIPYSIAIVILHAAWDTKQLIPFGLLNFFLIILCFAACYGCVLRIGRALARHNHDSHLRIVPTQED